MAPGHGSLEPLVPGSTPLTVCRCTTWSSRARPTSVSVRPAVSVSFGKEAEPRRSSSALQGSPTARKGVQIARRPERIERATHERERSREYQKVHEGRRVEGVAGALPGPGRQMTREVVRAQGRRRALHRVGDRQRDDRRTGPAARRCGEAQLCRACARPRRPGAA